MNIGKIKAVGFAITKRVQGYRLLKNPEGVSGTQVKMIKHFNGINSLTLDKFEHYQVVLADFSKPKTKKTKQMLFVDKYVFFDNKFKKIITNADRVAESLNKDF